MGVFKIRPIALFNKVCGRNTYAQSNFLNKELWLVIRAPLFKSSIEREIVKYALRPSVGMQMVARIAWTDLQTLYKAITLILFVSEYKKERDFCCFNSNGARDFQRFCFANFTGQQTVADGALSFPKVLDSN